MTIKQKILHRASPVWSKPLLCAVLCVWCIASSSVPAQTPTDSEASKLRLIAGTGLQHGSYVAGIDISLSSGSHTYWKQPGDAGVPPVFAFTGSENVAKAEVLFPAPTRISAEGLQSFGYTNEIVFPVAVTPLDPARPTVLHVDVSYAVCDKICIPAHGDATLRLGARESGATASLVEAAVAAVPRPVTAGERAALAITPDKGAIPAAWTLTWRGATPLDDIFADAPEGFYFETRKKGADTWSLVAAQSVGQPKEETVPVSLILTKKNGANLLLTEKLDVAASTR